MDSRAQDALRDFFRAHPMVYKIGQAEGDKAATIYLGDWDSAFVAADLLNETLGSILRDPEPDGTIRQNDAPIVGKVWGRFHLSSAGPQRGGRPEFMDYGFGGLPYLTDDVLKPLQWRPEDYDAFLRVLKPMRYGPAIQRSEARLHELYGAFFSGVKHQRPLVAVPRFTSTQGIDRYVDDVLMPALEGDAVPPEWRQAIGDDIAMRMWSYAAHVNDPAVMEVLRALNEEQALAMEPAGAPLETKLFVIATVRNSLLEHVHAEEGGRHIPDPQERAAGRTTMRDVVEAAIRFFDEQGIPCATSSGTRDVFGELLHRYPLASAALYQVVGLPRMAAPLVLPKLRYASSPPLPENLAFHDLDQRETNCGIDPSTKGAPDAPVLLLAFWKNASRNPEWVLWAVERALRANGAIVTANFFLLGGEGGSPSGRRTPPLTPVHTAAERSVVHLRHAGCTPQHQAMLRFVGGRGGFG